MIIIVLCLILDSRQNRSSKAWVCNKLYCALFWIQGKTGAMDTGGCMNCTVPYFGFKAKRRRLCPFRLQNCTVPYFGFKAKQVD